MATIAGGASPFRRSYKWLQRLAHEKPAIYYSFILAAAGPIAMVVVPPVRKTYFGYKAPEEIPRSYPLPNRPRNKDLVGYDD